MNDDITERPRERFEKEYWVRADFYDEDIDSLRSALQEARSGTVRCCRGCPDCQGIGIRYQLDAVTAERDALRAALAGAPSPQPPTEPCMSVGPRIGQQAPRCKLPKGHDGPHKPGPDDGWEHEITSWSDPWAEKRRGSGVAQPTEGHGCSVPGCESPHEVFTEESHEA